MQGCELSQLGSWQTGELSTSCKFLFEGTRYADANNATYGILLETPYVSSPGFVWNANAEGRFMNYCGAGDNYGVRPTIDIPYSLIAY